MINHDYLEVLDMDKPKQRADRLQKLEKAFEGLYSEISYLSNKIDKLEESVQDMAIAVTSLVKIYRNIEAFEKAYYNFDRKQITDK